MRASDLSAIAERADAATPGPWHVEDHALDRGEHNYTIEDIERWRGLTNNVHFGEDLATAEFVAHAIIDVPVLLNEVMRLREGIQECITIWSLGNGDAYVIADFLQGLISEVRA